MQIKRIGIALLERLIAFLAISIGCIGLYYVDDKFELSKKIPIFSGVIGSIYATIIYEICYILPKSRKNSRVKTAREAELKTKVEKSTFSQAYQVITQSENEIARRVAKISGSITTLARMISDRKAKKELNEISAISDKIIANFDLLKNEISKRAQ